MLERFGVSEVVRIEFWQCIGMFVAVYAIGYWFASIDLFRYWPFVLVGLIGKLLGPVGAVAAVTSGGLPASFLWLNVTNDFIWWCPFAWILWIVYRNRTSLGLRGVHNSKNSLYRRVLGSRFDELEPRIREFHDATNPIEVRGEFNVLRGPSLFGNFLTDRSHFPRSCEALPVSLRVEPTPAGERWYRSFGDSVVESWQCEEHGLLAERFGSLVMYLHAEVVAGALEVTDIRSTFRGIPLPPFLTPRVYAHGIDNDGGIQVLVRISSSPFGLLVEYRGAVALTA